MFFEENVFNLNLSIAQNKLNVGRKFIEKNILAIKSIKMD